MARGRSFSPVEEKLIMENYDLTIAELEALFVKNGYRRSRKSINRKLEKLREEGRIGMRSKDTIRRSYKQRTISDKNKQPQPIDTSWGGGFKRGGNSFRDAAPPELIEEDDDSTI